MGRSFEGLPENPTSQDNCPLCGRPLRMLNGWAWPKAASNVSFRASEPVYPARTTRPHVAPTVLRQARNVSNPEACHLGPSVPEHWSDCRGVRHVHGFGAAAGGGARVPGRAGRATRHFGPGTCVTAGSSAV